MSAGWRGIWAAWLMAAAGVVAGAAEPAAIHTASGTEIVYVAAADRSEEGLEYLRELDREIGRLFHAPSVRGGRLRIVLSPERGADVAVLRRTEQRTELLLGDHFFRAAEQFAFRRRLTGLLLLARFDSAGGVRELPDWVIMGLDGVLAANRSSGRIARNIHYYPLLQALIQSGHLPDFRTLTGFREADFSGAALEGMRELCRFMLETAAQYSSVQDNALGDYAVGCLNSDRRAEDVYEATIGRRLAGVRPGLTEQQLWSQAANRAAFNSRTPRPGAYSLKLLPGILQFEYAAVGKDGEASGKKRKGTFLDLPRLLREEHPSAALLQRQLVAAVREFSNGLPGDVLPYSEKLAAAIEQQTGSAFSGGESQLREALAELEQALKHQAAVEELLEKVEKERISPYVFFRRELEEVSVPDDAASRAVTKFLDETEKRYLEE